MRETQTVDLVSWLTAIWDEEERGCRQQMATQPIIARHLLARIAADRRILELHSCHMVSSLDSHFQRIPGTEHPCCDTCASQDENGERWPCTTVLALASPYADRPGFQESWR